MNEKGDITAPKTTARMKPLQGKRILIVEDEAISSTHLKKILSRGGYNVVGMLASGEEVMQQVARTPPDLLLMDIQLAGEMDGVETAEQIRAHFDLPVIYLTAYTDDALLQRAKNTEPYSYLIKPVQERELLITVEMALYKHEVERKYRDHLEELVEERTAELTKANEQLQQEITERKQMEEALQQSRTRLQLLNGISSRIIAQMPVEQIIKDTVQHISLDEYFSALRVTYSTIDAQGKITVLYSIEPPGMPKLSGLEADLNVAPGYLSALLQGDMVIAGDVSRDTRLAPLTEAMLAGGTRALLDVPVIRTDTVVALLCFNSPQPRQWSEHEIITLTDVAEYLSIAINEAQTREARRQAEEELEQRAQQLIVLRELDRAITTGLDINNVYRAFTHHAARLLSYDRLSIALVQGDEEARIAYVFGEGGTLPSVGTLLPLKSSVTKWVIDQGRPLLLNDHTDNVHLSQDVSMTATEILSSMVVPLRAKGQVIGTWNIGSRQSEAYSADDFEMTQIMADQLAIAIENAQLYEQAQQEIAERKRAEEMLEQHAQKMTVLNILGHQVSASLVVEQIVTIVLGSITAIATPDLALIYLLPEDQLILQGVHPDTPTYGQNETQLQVGECLCGLAVSQGKSVFSADIHCDPRCTVEACQQAGMRSFAALLLQKSNQILGVLGLAWVRQRDFDEQITFWETMSNQIAIGLQNALLYEQVMGHAEELEQRVASRTRELTALYEVTAVASQNLDLQTTLERVLERVLVAMESEIGVIHLLDKTSGKLLYLAVQQGFSPDLAAQIETMPVGSGLAGWVIKYDKPLIVPDTSADPRLIIPPSDLGAKIYVGVPMRAGGQVVGTLSLFRETTQLSFSPAEITLLTSIADQVGVVIESTRLHQQAEQAAVIEERQRLARDLHDSVTQSLYSVTLLTETGRQAAAAGDMKVVENCLHRAEDVTLQALKEMRLLVYQLRPPTLEYEGLVRALQQRLDTVESRAGIEARLLVQGELEFTAAREEILYRITLEALNNALKHASATAVTVRICVDGELVRLEITDNGQGFDLDATAGTGGMGLAIMQERVEQLGGALTIVSSPGEGTTVKVALSSVPDP